MATKRRRVWVNFYSNGTGFTLPSRAKAKETAAPGAVEVAVPMVERLPGDVVLSREEVKRLTELVWFLSPAARSEALALFRGRR